MAEPSPWITAVEAITYLIDGEFLTSEAVWSKIKEAIPSRSEAEIDQRRESRVEAEQKPDYRQPPISPYVEKWRDAERRLFDAHSNSNDPLTLLCAGRPIP